MQRLVCILGLLLSSPSLSWSQERVTIHVDTNVKRGPMTTMWAWFGYDEPNYTCMKDGRKLLAELQRLSPVPVHVRTHNLLTSGDGTAALKWGSTNAYTEDANGPTRSTTGRSSTASSTRTCISA